MTRSKMINRPALAVAGVAILGASVAVVNGSTSQAAGSVAAKSTRPSPVPPNLSVPAGNVMIADFAAHGAQVYQCTAGAWVFVEPAANLIGRTTGRSRTYQSAIHFRGPSWESTTDGSLVTASVVANSPVPGSIPLLLLKATTTRGEGVFGQVSYLQRLDTTGGAAPTGTCVDGETTGVSYTAKYRFFAPS